MCPWSRPVRLSFRIQDPRSGVPLSAVSEQVSRRIGVHTRARSEVIRALRKLMLLASLALSAPEIQRYRRMCTLCTSPIKAKKVTMLDPP